MFKFGENWASFSHQLDEDRVNSARRSLISLFGENELKGKTFLDIGCGSGLFSIAAAQLGAVVTGIDIDPVSIRTSQENLKKWLPDSTPEIFQVGSVLDNEKLKALGRYDIVYSWGVLHHTGSMHHAVQNAARCVKNDGLLMIAIYNRHWSSPIWKPIKWLYNHMGDFGQKILIWMFTPIILVAKWLVTFKNPLKMGRGMDFMHNIIDWVGGYPYEYSSVSEMTETLKKLGFQMLLVRPAIVPTGCNEFVGRLGKEWNLH